MTDINRRRLAKHYRALGRKDHPYCLEFPDEVPGTLEKAKALDGAKVGLVCAKCGQSCKSPAGLASHNLHCKGG